MDTTLLNLDIKTVAPWSKFGKGEKNVYPVK